MVALPVIPKNELNDVIDANRKRLASKDKSLSLGIIKRYALLVKWLDSEIVAFRAIDTLNATNKQRLERYVTFRNQLAVQIVTMNKTVGAEVADNITLFAKQGRSDARKLVSDLLDSDGSISEMWRRIPDDALMSSVFTFLAPDKGSSPIAEYTAIKMSQGNFDTAMKIEQIMLRNVVTGKSYVSAAREIQRVAGVSLSHALMFARSVTMTAYREGQIATWQGNDHIVKGWMWSANLHSLNPPCAACVRMHGTRHNLQERMNSHRNCRCVMKPITAEWGDIGITDVDLYRNDLGSETAGMEWLATQPKDVQLRVLGPTKYDMWLKGEIDLKQLATLSYDPLLGTVVTEQTVRALKEAAEDKKRRRELTRQKQEQAALENITDGKTVDRSEFDIIADIKRRFPDMDIDVTGMSPSLRLPVLQILDEFTKEFPEAARRLHGFVTDKSGKQRTQFGYDGVIGHVSPHRLPFTSMDETDEFEFQVAWNTKKHMVSLFQVEKEAETSYKTNWRASEHPMGIVHHELAHVLFNHFKYNLSKVYKDANGQSADLYYQDWLKEHNDSINHISRYAETSFKKAKGNDNTPWRSPESYAEPEAENYSNVRSSRLPHLSAKMHHHFIVEMYKMIEDGTFKKDPTLGYGTYNFDPKIREANKKRLDYLRRDEP